MNNNYPRKQLITLSIVCAVILVLAIVIGLINKNSGSAQTPSYVVEEDTVTR